MIAAATFMGASISEVMMILAIAGFALERFADARGWSRSSKSLRRENEDLARRNSELEDTVKRHEESIVILKTKVQELERQSQAAVLERLVDVERLADARHAESLAVLQKIAANTLPPHSRQRREVTS